ncbi:response regulator [Paenibacillus sp. PsM32]|uniref:Response regulator n=1 Tax=Paenibacillus kyungheensis TaxID=1452732 RepID=A0AAX3M379_9BACL|nr:MULTISPECIES: response regulator [Paenibacillus]MDN4617476.1 response regulator [Paenibacillus sp. PsM32]MDQ1232678.1 two-component system cell cycle response regulator DivK [Paenibacillus sp. SORGH_AS_0306]MDR6109728.1 two-component system cell cycle response regulator DivK [Paenibacillus sp. SORGH_AS_0338]WCT56709.1 response regulator [Paenibacillus kyungheensis]
MEHKNIKILYIEDDGVNMLLMRHLFKKKLPSVELLEASTIQEGIGLAIKVQPFLILSDIHFLGMNGFEGITQLKADPRTSMIPVWAISAFVLEEDIRKGKDAGFEQYITKPIHIGRFSKLLEAYIEQKTS